MQDLTKFHISESTGNILTAKGVIASDKYLIAPEDGKKHSLEIVFKPGTDVSLLQNEMAKIVLPKVKGDKDQAKKLVSKRFLDPNDKPGDGKPMGPEFEGWTLIRASSSHMPDFIMPDGTKCPESKVSSELYRGRWGRASFNPYWLDTVLANGTKVRGIFLGLVNIQLLDHGTPIGYSKPEGASEFGAVDVDVSSAPAAAAEKSDGDVESLFG